MTFACGSYIFPSDAVVACFFDVLLALWLGCLCAHSLPLRSIVCSKYDPNMYDKQGQRTSNLLNEFRNSHARLFTPLILDGF
jgi:hypothetical protein